MRLLLRCTGAAAVLLLGACSPDSQDPTAPDTSPPTAANRDRRDESRFNLNVLLGGADHAFGLLLFRQRADDPFIVHLNTFVFGLAPNTSYLLQRAVDEPDGSCTSEGWLTLGKGLTPQQIETNNRGFGHEELFRNLSAFPAGSTFDIHFRITEAATGRPVLASGCYQFSVRG
jgi:hypothetical protein